MGQVRQPRVRVLVNGTQMSGLIDASWTVPLAYECGTFNFTKALVPGGAEPFNAAFWAATASKTITVTIQVQIGAGAWVTQIVGQVDGHAWDVLAGTIQCNGRDLTSVFIDSRTIAAYPNLSVAEIVSKVAAEHSVITAVEQDADTTLAGRFYASNHTTVTDGNFASAINEWDLLCTLGRYAGVVPYVQGTTLYFQAPPVPPPAFAVTIPLLANGMVQPGPNNPKALQLHRSLVLARDVTVKVTSWHSGNEQLITATVAGKSVAQLPGDTDAPTKYFFEFPNMTQAETQAAAQRLALEISAHERGISVTVPGEITIGPEHLIQLSGTGTPYDMLWFPTSVTRSISQKGFETKIEAKNSSPLTLYDGASGAAIGGPSQSGPY
jgi:hypothetical protein